MAQSFFPQSWNLRPLWGARAVHAPHTLRPGLRIYAVGDVHGRLDCLFEMEERIAKHQARVAEVDETLIILLGDYIDRGPSSAEVIDVLARGTFAGLATRCLMGNHEEAMLGFLEDPEAFAAWLSFGGIATLASYGVRAALNPDRDALEAIRQDLANVVPDTHLAFLRGLDLFIEIDDYLFVHAGIRPGLALEDQRRADLLGIREPFLSAKARLPWRVVHGHTVLPQPVLGHSRISLDTGAYATGRLSCAIIEGDSVELLG